MRNSIDGLLKVLIWRMDGAITDVEFTQIYLEWMKKRDIHRQLMNTSSIQSQEEFKYFLDLLQNYLKDYQNIETKVPKILDIFRE